jgi:hypothetical protein
MPVSELDTVGPGALWVEEMQLRRMGLISASTHTRNCKSFVLVPVASLEAVLAGRRQLEPPRAASRDTPRRSPAFLTRPSTLAPLGTDHH